MEKIFVRARGLGDRDLRRIKLLIAYDGTPYLGWQIQAKGETVQGVMEKVISKVLKEEIRLVGSGRTDTGVHALGQVAHFDTHSHLDCEIMKKAFNANLPQTIVVRSVEEVGPDFHARFSAKSRQYRYFITSCRLPFWARYTWFFDKKLDLEVMREACKLFVGEHDFKVFGSPMSPGGSTVREIYLCHIKKKLNRIEVVVEANAFLKRMVRNIVGAIVKIGEGKASLEELRNSIERGLPFKGLKPAPSSGLFLWRVFY